MSLIFWNFRGNEQEVKNTSSDKKKQKALRWQQEQEKRNQKKRLERDNKYRKKFKVTHYISMR